MLWRGPGLFVVMVLAVMASLATAVWRDDPAVVASSDAPGIESFGAVAARQGHAPVTGRAATESRGAGVGPRARTGSRKAVPVTRGQELGLRFRPDERDPYYGAPTFPSGAGRQPQSGVDDAQFRPVPKRRKRTYEELQAEQRGTQPMAPIGPMPGMPPTLPAPPGGALW